MFKSFLLAATLCAASAAVAHEYKIGDLEIVHPHLAAPPAGARTAAGYLTVINHGTTDDRLTGISAGFAPMAMLHRSVTDANGIATMDDVPALDIPAGATVEVAPGGYHIMFMGPTGPFELGAMLPARLTFEKAGSVDVEFKVEKPGAAHDHAKSAAGG